MTDQIEFSTDFWDTWHFKKNTGQNDTKEPFKLAVRLTQIIEPAPSIKLLDLACGKGHDSLYFDQLGYFITGIDLSTQALQYAKSNLKTMNSPYNVFCNANIACTLPFVKRSFTGIYSHLGLHYFDDIITKSIFSEIWRILKVDGLLVFAVKSVNDPKYGKGEEIAKNIFNHEGHIRHFFDVPYVNQILSNFQILEVCEYSEIYNERKSKGCFLHVVARKP